MLTGNIDWARNAAILSH